MKKFKITVNGQTYEVEVEEVNGTPSVSAPPAAAPQPSQAAPKAETTASAPAVSAAPAAPVQAAKEPIPDGAIIVKAPMPGKISAVKCEAGKVVKRGDVVVVLEAMKMQNDITAISDGTLHEVRVGVGDNVKTGDILAVIVK